MAPLRSVEEIRSQIRLFESIMEREQRGTNCMLCSGTYEGFPDPEMLITILKHTYCKICITLRLQTDDANEFITGVKTGWSANPAMLNVAYGDSEISSEESGNETAYVEYSDGVQSFPRGYVYPNSKFMQNVQEGIIRNKKVPYASLRMNAETKLKQKVQKRTGKKKGPFASLRMNAKPHSHSLRQKQKAESRKSMWPTSINSEAASNECTLWSTGHKNRCDEDWLPEQGIRRELLHEIGDDDRSHQSESVNKP